MANQRKNLIKELEETKEKVIFDHLDKPVVQKYQNGQDLTLTNKLKEEEFIYYGDIDDGKEHLCGRLVASKVYTFENDSYLRIELTVHDNRVFECYYSVYNPKTEFFFNDELSYNEDGLNDYKEAINCTKRNYRDLSLCLSDYLTLLMCQYYKELDVKPYLHVKITKELQDFYNELIEIKTKEQEAYSRLLKEYEKLPVDLLNVLNDETVRKNTTIGDMIDRMYRMSNYKPIDLQNVIMPRHTQYALAELNRIK